ncbi:MAG: oxygenase MpaB family protein [Bacteroidia bacterium]
MSTFEPLSWETQKFNTWFAGYRQMQDKHADDVASTIMASPHRNQVYAALGSIVKNDDVITLKTFEVINHAMSGTDSDTDEEHQKLVSLLNNYFEDNNDPKHFFITDDEIEILKKGAMIFNTRTVECTLILAVRSLLKQYAAYNATQVLGSTKILPDFPHRRILATMQFVLDVMSPDAFTAEGSGKRAIQKLRLVHALIRARINLKSAQDAGNQKVKGDMDISTTFWEGGEWRAELWGSPINQQDMIFAVHTFSVEVIEGLIESGEDISDDDKETYYKAWHIIGRHLGVLTEINPDNYNDGKELQQRIYDVQFIPVNPNGTPLINKIAPALADPLVAFVQQFARLPKIEYVYAIIKRFNNDIDESFFEDKLKIPLSQLSRKFLWIIILADKLQDFIFDAWSWIRYFKSRDNNSVLSVRMHNMMQAVVDSQATWGAKHFMTGDGFGRQQAEDDQKKLKAGRPSFFKIAIKAFLSGKINQ